MSRWSRFVERAPASGHAVQVYDHAEDLAATLGDFLAAGLRDGSPAVVIATAEHRELVAQALAERGWPPADLERRGLLHRADARATLELLTDGGRPSRERFRAVVGGLMSAAETAAPGRTVRAFGEMVDVLWQDGRERAAIELEELWNELAAERRFALLCAYRLDVLDPHVQARLPSVLRVHSHARAVAEPARFAAAVDRALTEVVGPRRAARIYLDVADQVPRDDVPRAQAVLMWLTANQSSLAGEVLRRVRAQLEPVSSRPEPTPA
jgi:hypothetical protein